MVRTIVGRVDDDGVVGDPHGFQAIEDRTNVFIVLKHARTVAVMPNRELPSFFLIFRGHARERVHAVCRKPDEERLLIRAGFVHELESNADRLFVDGFHSLSRERVAILDTLFADLSAAGIDRLVTLVGSPGVQHSAGAVLLLEVRIARVVFVFRFFLVI